MRQCGDRARLAVEARLQRRIQRYGWDRAAGTYESLWQPQLAGIQSRMLAAARLSPGAAVLDVACGTGLVTLAAAEAVGASDRVLGVDISEQMLEVARRKSASRASPNLAFARMDAECLALPDRSFDVVLCGLGLMYLPDPERALREMRRVLRPGGRAVICVWGERERCGWAEVFPIVETEVASEVCPLFFSLGQSDTLAHLCRHANFADVEHQIVNTTLAYRDAEDACNAAFAGGPVALAWSRFDAATRARVKTRYLQAIDRWRHRHGHDLPAEFVIAVATAGR